MALIDEGIAGGLKKYSTIALALIVALQTAWAASTEVQTFLGPDTLNLITGVLAVLGFIGRFIKQVQPVLGE